MFLSAKAIIDAKNERANAWTQINAITTEFENKEIDAIKKDELTKSIDKFDALSVQITASEKNLNRSRLMGEEQPGTPTTPKVEDKMRAFSNYLRDGSPDSLKVYNALSQDNPTQAGALVLDVKFVSGLIKTLDNLMFIRQKCKTQPMLQGAKSLGYVKRTARMSAAVWGTEIAAPTADTQLAFGTREFKTNPATAEILEIGRAHV